MLKKNKITNWILEISFFFTLLFISSILYYPLSLNIIFNHQVVASVLLQSQNREYRLLKQTKGIEVSYFIQQKKILRQLASKPKAVEWLNTVKNAFIKPSIPLKGIKNRQISKKQFTQYFQKITDLIWTLKYKNPNFQLDPCKKTIAKLQLDKNTHLDICVARPLGLAKLAPLLKDLQRNPSL